MSVEGGGRAVVHSLGSRYIGHDTDRVMTGDAKLVDRGVEWLRFDVGQHHLHPSLGEPVRHRQADTACRSGDYGYSIL